MYFFDVMQHYLKWYRLPRVHRGSERPRRKTDKRKNLDEESPGVGWFYEPVKTGYRHLQHTPLTRSSQWREKMRRRSTEVGVGLHLVTVEARPRLQSYRPREDVEVYSYIYV